MKILVCPSGLQGIYLHRVENSYQEDNCGGIGLDTHFQQLAPMPQQDERIRAQYTRPADQPTPTFNSWPRCHSKTNEYGLSIRGLPTHQHPLPTVGPDRLLTPITGPNIGRGGDGCIKVEIPSRWCRCENERRYSSTSTW
ncbi:hypothetical protein [Absidia glauca]|uniref:Uncharacterized protein n=1 Tax=Absidia glauca TaxID=4829 RepID=A0A168QI29_ABSGL|nr:hypothetical protein [Absidia glauca]